MLRPPLPDLDPSTPRVFRALFQSVLKAPRLLRPDLMALLQAVMRRTHCARGKHARSGNYCIYGCGTLLNKDAFKDWVVVLTSGEQQVVSAINAHHAASLVVYGPRLRIDGNTGAVLGSTMVHPANIASVRLADQRASNP